MDPLGKKPPVSSSDLQPMQPQAPRPSLLQRFRLRRPMADRAQPTQGRGNAPLPRAPSNPNYLQAMPLTSRLVDHFLTDDDRRAFSQVNHAANQSVNSDPAFVLRNYRVQINALRQMQQRVEPVSAHMKHSPRPIVRKLEGAAETVAKKAGINYQAYATRQGDADARVQNLSDELKSLRRNYVVHAIDMLDRRNGADRAVPHLATIHNLQDLLMRWDTMSHEVRLRELLAVEEQLVRASDQVATLFEVDGFPVQNTSGSADHLHHSIWQLRETPGDHFALRNRLEMLQDRLIHLAVQDICSSDDQPPPSRPPQSLVNYHQAPDEPWHSGKNIVCQHTDPDTGAMSTKSEPWPQPSGQTDYVRFQFPTPRPGWSFIHVYAVNRVSVMEEPDG